MGQRTLLIVEDDVDISESLALVLIDAGYLVQTARDGAFHTFLLDTEVHDVEHLMRLIAALRATDVVSSAERL